MTTPLTTATEPSTANRYVSNSTSNASDAGTRRPSDNTAGRSPRQRTGSRFTMPRGISVAQQIVECIAVTIELLRIGRAVPKAQLTKRS
jgi:hypothetical protein